MPRTKATSDDIALEADEEQGTASKPNYSVPAVEKALDILEYLAAEGVPMTRAQLARALNRQPPELFRMLTCLEARGYLWRDSGSNAYALTLKLFELSRTHSPYEGLLRVAAPHMRALAAELRESLHLSMLHGHQVMVIAQEESPKPFRLSVEVGSLHSLAGTTSGRVLLANHSDDETAALLRRDPAHRQLSAAGKQSLRERLERIRAQGYEWSEGEWFESGIDLGVLVGSPESRVKAALVMATLRRKGEGPTLEAVLPALQQCARAIGQSAGIIKGDPV
ncbi:IclR family transcriptional regulator [Caballeronia hypogeia]|uniref:IclR family transcriptional regulator n=1 Tax=Caballeronia hypogeia TaxID=1777140 RepID=A0A158BW09_9BURK|nr:IclR family transcriptional regulator [Caballeronia hypogeia]SAK74282.1 IclR family transcriptional regulator [Caballeronia hypogeia]